MLVIIKGFFITFSFLLLVVFAQPVFAIFVPPSVAPPGNNVEVPIYSDGTDQDLAGGLDITSGSLDVESGGFTSVVTTGTSILGTVGSATGVAVQGTNGATSVYGLQTAGTDLNSIYGNASSGNYAGRFEGIVNINSLVEISAGPGQGIRYIYQDTGVIWPDDLGDDLFGIYVKSSNNALRLVGHGGGIEFTDKTADNVRMSITEAGVVNVAAGGLLQVNSVNVCLSDGTNCQVASTPTLQSVTTAGNTTTNSADFQSTIINSTGSVNVNDDLQVAGDIYMINNKAIRLDAAADTNLIVGNFNDGTFAYGGTYDANIAVEGDVQANRFCIDGNSPASNCKDSWTEIGGSSGWTDDGANVRLTAIGDNVGIGTINPDDKLHVVGNMTIEDGSGEITFETGASHYNWRVAVKEITNAAYEIHSGNQDSDATNDVWTQRFMIEQDGDVVIPTAAGSLALGGFSPDATKNLTTPTLYSGTLTVGNDIYVTDNKSIRIDSGSDTTLLFGNYNDGAFAYGGTNDLNIAVEGDVQADRFCIDGNSPASNCKASWGDIAGDQTLLEVLTVGSDASAFSTITKVGGDIEVGADKHFIARYTSNDTHRSLLQWQGLQLGNNGANYIVAGNTATGGTLNIVVNNSNDTLGNPAGYNGTLALTIDASGNLNVPAGQLQAKWLHSTTGGNNTMAGNLGVGKVSVGAGLTLDVAGDTKITGDLEVTGDLSFGTGADLAEEFTSTKDIDAGTVIVMGNNGYKSAIISTEEYDNRVIGVVSDDAAITMGRVEGPNKSVIALIGVVKVKVIGYNGNIEKGDLLTTSNVAGHAMKAEEPKIGTIIGKALESFNGDKGEIMVLINLQ